MFSLSFLPTARESTKKSALQNFSIKKKKYVFSPLGSFPPSSNHYLTSRNLASSQLHPAGDHISHDRGGKEKMLEHDAAMEKRMEEERSRRLGGRGEGSERR